MNRIDKSWRFFGVWRKVTLVAYLVRREYAEVRHWPKKAFPSRRSLSQAPLVALDVGHLAIGDDDSHIRPFFHRERVNPGV